MYFLFVSLLVVSGIHGSASSTQPPSYTQAMAGSRIMTFTCTVGPTGMPDFRMNETAYDEQQMHLPSNYLRISLGNVIYYVTSDVDCQELMDVSTEKIETVAATFFDVFMQEKLPGSHSNIRETFGSLTLQKLWFLILIQNGLLKLKCNITGMGDISLRTLFYLYKELSAAMRDKLKEAPCEVNPLLFKCHQCRLEGKGDSSGDIDYVCSRGHHLCIVCKKGLPVEALPCFCGADVSPLQ